MWSKCDFDAPDRAIAPMPSSPSEGEAGWGVVQ